jgi:hypothetical protein
MKTYDIHAKIEMTAQARNAGATGRKYWWAFVDRVQATSGRAACAAQRKSGSFAYAVAIKAIVR